MMEAATVHDFCVQDLTRPQPKRFKRHMSALVNFFRFRSDRLAEFDELVLETEDLETRRLEWEESMDRTRQAIAEIVARRKHDEPRVKQLQEENLAHADRLLEMKKEQGRLLAEGAPQALLHRAFGAARLLSIRLVRPASHTAAQRFTRAGLTQADDGVQWRRLCEDALALAQSLAPVVDGEGGEVAVRRPGLDDLVAHLSGASS